MTFGHVRLDLLMTEVRGHMLDHTPVLARPEAADQSASVEGKAASHLMTTRELY